MAVNAMGIVYEKLDLAFFGLREKRLVDLLTGLI